MMPEAFEHGGKFVGVMTTLGFAPLVIIAVVVAYLTSEALTAYVDARIDMTPDKPETAPAPGPA